MEQHVTAAPASVLASVLSGAAGYAVRAAELLVDTSLTLDRWRVLELVARHPELTMSGLATQLGVPSSTATRIVDSLVADGALHRVVDLTDRRRVGLKLTERGRAIEIEARQHLEPLETEIDKLVGGGHTAGSDDDISRLAGHLIDQGRAPARRGA